MTQGDRGGSGNPDNVWNTLPGSSGSSTQSFGAASSQPYPSQPYPSQPYPSQPYQQGGDGSSGRRGMSGGMIALIAGLVVVLLALIVVVIVLLVRPGDSSSDAAPITQVVTSTRSPGAAGAGSAPAAAPAPAAPAAPAAPNRPAAPADASLCDDTGAASFGRAAVGSSVTTCSFADAVRSAYLAGGHHGESAFVYAYSPVTGLNYLMQCSGNGAVVRCTGGNDAVVYVY